MPSDFLPLRYRSPLSASPVSTTYHELLTFSTASPTYNGEGSDNEETLIQPEALDEGNTRVTLPEDAQPLREWQIAGEQLIVEIEDCLGVYPSEVTIVAGCIMAVSMGGILFWFWVH